jgi:hypothetical protein
MRNRKHAREILTYLNRPEPEEFSNNFNTKAMFKENPRKMKP